MVPPTDNATLLFLIRGDKKLETVPENNTHAIVILGSLAGLIDPVRIRIGRCKPLPNFAISQGDHDYFPEGAELFPAVAAKESHFGSLTASSWHVNAIAMGLLTTSFKAQGLVSLGSPGINRVRWFVPAMCYRDVAR